GPSGINPGFPGLSQYRGQITHVLLTRSPLSPGPKARFSLDLHVLSAPPAFVLSQDQTLHEDRFAHRPRGFATQPACKLLQVSLSSKAYPYGHDGLMPPARRQEVST